MASVSLGALLLVSGSVALGAGHVGHFHGYAANAVAAQDSEVRLRTEFRSVDGLHVDVVLSNEGPRPVTVLTRDTPLDPRRLAPPLRVERLLPAADLLSVEVQAVDWEGRLAKRLPPGPDELLELAPGESVSARVALDVGWHLSSAGDYRIGLASPWRTAENTPRELIRRSLTRRQRLDHDFLAQPMPAPVELSLLDNASPLDALRRLRPPQYDQCSVDQQQGIVEAASTAERLTSESVAALRSLSAAQLARSPRYRTWFGDYDQQRAGSVLADLSAVADTLADDGIRFNCDCGEQGVFAFVYPTRPYEVWLCPAFWNASVEGADSRAGTVVHELSHFRIVAGTRDHVYTQGRAQQLAESDPDLAANNADTFEYFVENTPFLPLLAGDDATGGVAGPVNGGAAPANDPAGSPSDDTVNEPVVARLEQGEQHRYTIDRGLAVRVESLEGDADLRVFRGESVADVNLLCSSAQPPAVSGTDRCDLDGAAPWTVVVVAFTDTRYRLSVESATTGGQAGPVNDDPGGQGVPTGGSAGDPGDGSGGGVAGPGVALLLALLAAMRHSLLRLLSRRSPVGSLTDPLVDPLAGRQTDALRARLRPGVSALMLVAAAGSGCASHVEALPAGAGAGADGMAGGAALRMSLEGVPEAASSVRVTLHNRSSQPARVLSWNTPFEATLSADIFVVQAQGTRADYTGRQVKRALPAPEDAWLVLQPGERRQAELDLARYYAIQAGGPWQVTLDAARLQGPSSPVGARIAVPGGDEPVVLHRGGSPASGRTTRAGRW